MKRLKKIEKDWKRYLKKYFIEIRKLENFKIFI